MNGAAERRHGMFRLLICWHADRQSSVVDLDNLEELLVVMLQVFVAATVAFLGLPCAQPDVSVGRGGQLTP